MNRAKQLLLLLCPFVLSLQLSAQDFVMDGTPITACSGTFFDPGGVEDYLPETEVFLAGDLLLIRP